MSKLIGLRPDALKWWRTLSAAQKMEYWEKWSEDKTIKKPDFHYAYPFCCFSSLAIEAIYKHSLKLKS